MPYRRTHRSAEQMERMRAARAAARLVRPAPDYTHPLPVLRRRIEIRDYDFGETVHVVELYRSSRIDCYRVVADGVEWKKRMGFSQILAGIRRALPRLMSPSRLD